MLSAVSVTSGANPFPPHLFCRLNTIKLVSFLFRHLWAALLWAPHCFRHNWSLRSCTEASTAALWGSLRKCKSPAVQVSVIAESFSLSFFQHSVTHLSSGLELKLSSPSLMVSFSWSATGHHGSLSSFTLKQHCHFLRTCWCWNPCQIRVLNTNTTTYFSPMLRFMVLFFMLWSAISQRLDEREFGL